MRKKLIGFLLVPVLLLAIVSCDGDIFGTISDFMGQTGANVYVDGGLVQVDTSQGATVSNALAGLSTDPVPTDTDSQDYADYVTEYKEQVNTAKTAIVEALVSETKKAAWVEAMSTELPIADDNPIEDIIPPRVQGIVTDFNAADIGVTIDYDGIQTEGDLIALVLITEFYDSVKNVDFESLEPEEALALVSEAQQVIEIVQAISPTGAATLDDILGQLIGDQALLDQLFRGTARSTTREGEDDFDPSTILEPIFNTIINAIGKGNDGYILLSGLKRMQTNFSMMRIAYEQMAPALAGSGKALELTDSINYALSVIFTEADAFFASASGNTITFEDAINDIIDWIDDGKDTENPPAFTDEIPDWGSAIDTYASTNAGKFSTDGSKGTVIKTIEALLRATPDTNFILVQLGLEESTT